MLRQRGHSVTPSAPRRRIRCWSCAKVERATLAALSRYVPGHFAGRVNLFLPSRELGSDHVMLRWRSVARRTEVYFRAGRLRW